MSSKNYQVHIFIFTKKELLDSASRAIEGVLQKKYPQLSESKLGRVFCYQDHGELHELHARASELAKKYLASPVSEEFYISIQSTVSSETAMDMDQEMLT